MFHQSRHTLMIIRMRHTQRNFATKRQHIVKSVEAMNSWLRTHAVRGSSPLGISSKNIIYGSGFVTKSTTTDHRIGERPVPLTV